MARNGSNEWKTAQLGDVIELFDSQRVPLNSRERQERKGEYPRRLPNSSQAHRC